MGKSESPESDKIVDATAWVHLIGQPLERERSLCEECGHPGLVAAAERVVIRADGRTQCVTAYRFGAP